MAVEPGTCRGLTAVTDKQFFYDTLNFTINPPGEGSMAEMMSVNIRKEEEGMKIYLPTRFGFRTAGVSEKVKNMRWRSCDFCLATETKEAPHKVCAGCSCERYHAGRYCR